MLLATFFFSAGISNVKVVTPLEVFANNGAPADWIDVIPPPPDEADNVFPVRVKPDPTVNVFIFAASAVVMAEVVAYDASSVLSAAVFVKFANMAWMAVVVE